MGFAAVRMKITLPRYFGHWLSFNSWNNVWRSLKINWDHMVLQITY